MKKYFYRSYPFIRLIIPVLFGRVLSLFFTVSIYGIGVFILLFVFTFLFFFFKLENKYSRRWIFGLFINLTLLIGSWINTDFYLSYNVVYDQSQEYRATVVDVSRSNNRSQILEVLTINESSDSKKYFKSIIFYNNKNDQYSFVPGDQIVFYSSMHKIKAERNPYAFNYRDYLMSRCIVGQFYLDSTNCKYIKSNFTINRGFFSARNWCKEKIKMVIDDDNASSILIALLLGDKTLINKEVKSDFSGAGLMHIISISGMHIGIVYMLLLFLFGGVNSKKLKKFKLYVILSILWFYAALTGMSPSVFRSALMFSVLLIAQLKSNVSYNIYHSLAIAASLILLLSPGAIRNTGFWLSFLAVLSIVYFFPKINSLFHFSKPWNKFVWSLFSLSVSAQLGTAPLAIYSFKYFSTWFLISNLLIVPIVPFVLLGGLVLIISPVGSVVTYLIASPLKDATLFIIEIAEWVNGFYISKFSGLQFEWVDLLCIYLALVLYVAYNQYKRLILGVSSLSLFLLFMVINLTFTIIKRSKTILVVHEISNMSAVSFISSNSCFCFMDTCLSENIKDRSVMPLWRKFGKNTIDHEVDFEDKIIPVCSRDFKGVILNDNTNIEYIKSLKEQLDLVIVTDKVSVALATELVKYFNDVKIVFDSSFSKKKAIVLSGSLLGNNKMVQFVSLSGAYCVER